MSLAMFRRPSHASLGLPAIAATVAVVAVVVLIVLPTSCTSFTMVQNRNTNLHHHRGNGKISHQHFMSMVSSTPTSANTGNGTRALSNLKSKLQQQKPAQTMKFIATKQVKTEPISIPDVMVDKNRDMDNSLNALLNVFFSNDSNRNLLFPNSNAESLNNVSENGNEYEQQELISGEFLEKWTAEAKLGGGEGPSVVQVVAPPQDGNMMNHHHHQTLYKLVNHSTIDIDEKNDKENRGHGHFQKQAIFKIDAMLQMPGLQIISESTIGMKLLLPSSSSAPSKDQEGEITSIFPEYQFTLLESNLKPKGRAPVVWLFNKLTKYRDSTSSFTKVRVEKVMRTDNQDQKQQQQIVFVTDAKMETRMQLPSKLLKVLPNVNIAKFESQGSASVQKLLEKELGPALNGFGRTFETLINRES